MWKRSNNCSAVQPPALKRVGDRYIVRRMFRHVPATEEIPEHWTYDEWQMTSDQYEVYRTMQPLIDEQSDALVELADIISEIAG